MTVQRPDPDEYAPFYAGYIAHVPAGDLFALLRAQPDALRALLGGLTEAQVLYRPAPGEWSVKEIVGHICDTERVFAYRALRIARGDTTPLPGFEQNMYVDNAHFDARPLADLLDEFQQQRAANLLCFQALTPAQTEQRGTASDAPVTVRALLYMLAGHVEHHLLSLREKYLHG